MKLLLWIIHIYIYIYIKGYVILKVYSVFGGRAWLLVYHGNHS